MIPDATLTAPEPDAQRIDLDSGSTFWKCKSGRWFIDIPRLGRHELIGIDDTARLREPSAEAAGGAA